MSTIRPLGFHPLSPLRAHQEVAEQIRRGIALRLLGSSGALPPERDLARQFGVGRATIQKAIGLLEAEGLVERRRGRTGGTFLIGHAESDGGEAALIETLRRNRTEIHDALGFRLAVEPAAGALAAIAASKDDLARIEAAAEAVNASTTRPEFLEHDTQLHLAIARASGNQFFVESVERLRIALNDALAALPGSESWMSWSTEEHDHIARAIRRHDAETARDAMAAHVIHTDDTIRALLRVL